MFAEKFDVKKLLDSCAFDIIFRVLLKKRFNILRVSVLMSFWIHTKDKVGRKSLVAIDFPVSMVITLICLLAAIFITFIHRQMLRYGAYSIDLIVAGVLSLAISKINRFRKGEWFTWGPKDKPKTLRVFYYLGYVLIFAGLALACNYFLRNS